MLSSLPTSIAQTTLAQTTLAQSAPKLNSHNTALLRRLTSGHVSAIAPDAVGGLLLVKPFYVDFAGPGAAVGGEFDRDCIAVYQVGTVRFQTLLTQHEREEAIQTRITYAEQLSVILDIPYAQQRGRSIVEQLTNWLPGNLSLTIPAELTAGLAGVLPKTIQAAWQVPKAIAADLPLVSFRDGQPQRQPVFA